MASFLKHSINSNCSAYFINIFFAEHLRLQFQNEELLFEQFKALLLKFFFEILWTYTNLLKSLHVTKKAENKHKLFCIYHWET